MIRKERDDLQWLEFELFSDNKDLSHGVFLRGGCSKEQFAKKGLEKIREHIGVPLLYSNQVHGTELVSIPFLERGQIGNCDGLLTAQRYLGLMIKHADCQAAIFYDPIKKAVANVHCGWRGNVQNIYAKTVSKMQQLYRSNPADILVGISPSLGPDRSEFINFRTEFPEEFLKFQFKPEYFDLWSISRWQLEESGILPDHIQIASVCTYSNPEDFFSYRRDKETFGGNATVAAIK